MYMMCFFKCLGIQFVDILVYCETSTAVLELDTWIFCSYRLEQLPPLSFF